ncbi:MAG TPA: aminotransferase class V-fold PLP-dependent enzyme [Acidimicrobiia bacterium]|nr:aminotransferase class V-fold PLP-dependent enzyme [Acidimicrobiia bacterium]
MADTLPSQRHLFDIPDGVAYLNCAYFPPMPRPVREAGRRALENAASPWNVGAADFFEPGERLRESFARLINGDADGVAFVPSVSYGASVAAANLPVGPGRTVVMVEEEFPSDVYPWREKIAVEGGEIVVVPRSRDRGWTDGFLETIDDRTAVVVAPACHWTDGSAVDLDRVGEAARSVGAAFVIDVSQSLGAAPLDVSRIEPDFLITVGYKWQMGPYAFGYLWAAEHRRSGRGIEATWSGRKGSEDFNRLVDYTDELRAGARRFDAGEWSNFVLMPMATAAIDLLHEWKPERVAATIEPLTGRIEQGTRSLGLEPIPAGHRLPHLIGVRFPMGEPPGLRGRLSDGKVFVSLRANAVRVAPHLYNDEEDVDRLLEVLESVL